LKNAEENEITEEEALYLFKETGRYDKALKLFEIASRVRDDEIGNVFKLDGFIGLITHCTVDPPCIYCHSSSNIKPGFGLENVLTIDEIVEGARLIEETGISMTELGGGTTVGSSGDKVIEAVKRT
jgi:biotin synthase